MFQLQAKDVPQLDSYEKAVSKYNMLRKDPRDPQVRLLSRNKDLTLEWRGGGEQRHLAACYNSQPVVRYYPDGLIELDHCGWETPSTRMFMYRVSPFYVNIHRGSLYVTADYKDESTEVVRGFFLIGRNTKLRFMGDVFNTPIILNPVQQSQVVLDRDRAKEVRQALKPFVTQFKMLASAITPTLALRDSYSNSPYGTPDTRGNIGMRIMQGNQEAFDVGITFFLRDAMDSLGWELRNGVTVEQWHVAIKRTIERLYKAVYMKDKCTKHILVPLGTIPARDVF